MGKKRTATYGAALCALLLACSGAAAEEKHIGHLIYVPAMTVQAQAGAVALRVEGVALGESGDEPVVAEQLSGAEFGVYVVSSSGELKPWANPLYPSEPMRIRTGEGETRFSLPQGTEFFLRQESAPEGYHFDSTALIPVTGEEIVVRNAMAGELVLLAQDSLGQPIEGVQFSVTQADGTAHTLVSDKNGEAVLACEAAGVYDVFEEQLPEGVFSAISMYAGRESDVVRQDVIGIAVSVSDATRTRVTFEHPASGSVLLNMQLATIDDNAQTVTAPLAGVRMDIFGPRLASMETDETGSAQVSLLEGEYTVRLTTQGGVVLPVSEGMMIVQSGATTVIDLTAVEPYGRIVLNADATRAIRGGSMIISSDATGDVYGPYALDGEGIAISQRLAPGAYHIEVTAPEDTQLGQISCGETSVWGNQELAVLVAAGEVTQVQAQMLTMEAQSYALLTAAVGETGEIEQTRIENVAKLELVDASGTVLSALAVEEGFVSVQGLTGTYTLRMDEKSAKALGVAAQSMPFTLPSEDEHIAFGSVSTRVIVSSVDENGNPVAGAVYRMVDVEGNAYSVQADEHGEAVSPLLAAGEVSVSNVTPPAEHDEAMETEVTASVGSAVHVQMVHERYGEAVVSMQIQRLDERGQAALAVLSGADAEIRDAQSGDVIAMLTAGEDGLGTVRLPAGEYVAVLDAQAAAVDRVGSEALFSVANTQQTQVKLIGYDALGGIRASLVGGELTDEQLAQVRFELIDEDGAVTALVPAEGAFYAGGLREGIYALRQTQMPQGYTLGNSIQVAVRGGELTQQDVPLEEYAVLSISKTGLTFNDRMQTFVVPLTGEYGVFVEQNGAMMPYPSEDAPMTVWSNVTPEQIAQGRAAQAKLPAAIEGTTYYLKELSAAQGFAQDDEYHAITLKAGDRYTYESTVSSDRGFFALDMLDAATGTHVSGGSYALLDAETMETVLSFEMGDAAYRNPMAIAVGRYLLRQTEAAPGYAMSMAPEMDVVIEPYLTQGGFVAQLQMQCAAIPQSEQLALQAEIYAAQEQGLTLLSVDSGALPTGETLLLPRMTLSIFADHGERTDVRSVLLDGAKDDAGGQYVARVEYCLADGGWQPSDARMSQPLDAPVAISLSDVTDDICAVRVTYVNAKTGEERSGSGFTPGRVTLDVAASADGAVDMTAQVQFTGQYAYTEVLFGETKTMKRAFQTEAQFSAQGSGLFETIPAGRDGRITGMAFFDADADGAADAEETSRYAGMNVSLLNQAGEVVASARTDGQGVYGFHSISSGSYTVQFDAGEDVVFSTGGIASAQRASGVVDTRYGMSDVLIIDGEHTDYVVNAGCLFAGYLSGAILEHTAEGNQEGYAGLIVEMYAKNAAEDEEPVVVVTGDSGEFAIGGILPGRYEVRIALPEGYLSTDAPDSLIVREVEFAQGDRQVFDLMTIERGVAVSGRVRIDDNGDGIMDARVQALAGVTVKLLAVEDGHTQAAAETMTDESGTYVFDMMPSGTYSVLFELPGEWAFTRYGKDSLVYGAAASSGSTQPLVLLPGQVMESIDAGVTIPAQLTVSVFQDTQFDGQKGVYEEMLEGVTVSLIRVENGEDAQEVTAVTGADGAALFDAVSPGEYVIAYQMPGAWRATKQVEPRENGYPVSCVPQSTLATGRSDVFTLGMGEKDARRYIGAMLSGSIAGTVFYDDDADAKQADSEAGVPAMLVELLNAQGDVVNTTVTDDSGAYVFEGLAPGRYRVQFTAEAGCGFAATERTMVRGSVQESDSNVSSTRPITIASGDAMTGAHAGVVRLGTLSGIIWEDSNADCATEEHEKLLAGVEVALMNSSGRNILTSTVTDEDGEFTFIHVRPGQYMLRVSAPEGYVFSGALTTGVLPMDDVRENRAYSSVFTMLGGATVNNIGYGLFTQGAIRGSIWQDADYDAVRTEAESGLRGATLTLLDENGEAVQSATSQRSGEFVLDRLTPGAYTLQVTLPEGYVFTRAGGASVVEETGAYTALLPLGTLAMGQTLDGVTIGALQPADVGGYIWMDRDDDGRRQVNDDVFAGLTVTLISEETQEPVETQTDESGAYRFETVMPGAYRLAFTLPQGHAFAKNASGERRVSCVKQVDALSATSDVFTVTSGVDVLNKDVGAVGVGTIDGMIWQDSQYDGQMGCGETGVPGTVVALIDAKTGKTLREVTSDENGRYWIDFVRAGEYTIRAELPSGMIFTREGESALAQVDGTEAKTQTFSVAMGESLEDLNIGAIVPAAVSGRLYIDENENGEEDAGEAGLKGAVITMMQGGTIIATCETDGDGVYLFDTLRPGAYRVRVTLPGNTLFANASVLRLDDPDALEGETEIFELEMGQQAGVTSVGTVNAASISGIAWSDGNADGRMDEDEPALHGTMAELLELNGQDGERVIASAEVDEHGVYAFGLLRSGSYAVRFTLPEGMLFADSLGTEESSSVPVVPGHVGTTERMTLAMGEALGTVHVGGIYPGSIGDSVWLDVDGNGLQDYREPLVPGVEIGLLRVERDGAMTEVDVVVSDEYGYYAFTDLRPGTYVVSPHTQEALTVSYGAPFGEIDSDVNPETGMTAEIRLASGQTLRNVDIGLLPAAN